MIGEEDGVFDGWFGEFNFPSWRDCSVVPLRMVLINGCVCLQEGRDMI